MQESGHRPKSKPNCFKTLMRVFPNIQKGNPRIKGQDGRPQRFLKLCRKSEMGSMI